jgi:leucyl aminopeptidase|tara:strand:+ start:1708 stop:3156 length:1449 start_codon:yes stop_codon:yes gene_type:complete
MNTKIEFIKNIPNELGLKKNLHHIIVVDPASEKYPFETLLKSKLKRVGKKLTDLSKTPVSTELDNGAIISWIGYSSDLSTFKINTLIRKGFNILSQEKPTEISISFLPKNINESWVNACVYVSLVNSQALPNLKKGAKNVVLKKIILAGINKFDLSKTLALVKGNTLTRNLTITPPNNLTPTIYKAKIKQLAKLHKWVYKDYSMVQLKKMGAGAFVAVGQGSEPEDAVIVHLKYTAKNSKKTIALVGKGICFDTGGHNLKPAKYMSGMHEDMNGSAVVLGILQAATEAKLPVNIDCWLAIAQNHIGPKAYKQNDVVTALNGLTIEIVHTDAEGRMVLADTLTMASRKKPQAIIDFATLTGCMHVAMGDRYSGVISNKSDLACLAVGAGVESGERIAAFPYDEDYEEDLESQIADIKQCNLEGGPDHIHAARFLGRFVENDTPWLHVDLSSSNRKGGLGGISSDVNGFGVSFGITMLENIIKK